MSRWLQVYLFKNSVPFQMKCQFGHPKSQVPCAFGSTFCVLQGYWNVSLFALKCFSRYRFLKMITFPILFIFKEEINCLCFAKIKMLMYLNGTVEERRGRRGCPFKTRTNEQSFTEPIGWACNSPCQHWLLITTKGKLKLLSVGLYCSKPIL